MQRNVGLFIQIAAILHVIIYLCILISKKLDLRDLLIYFVANERDQIHFGDIYVTVHSKKNCLANDAGVATYDGNFVWSDP